MQKKEYTLEELEKKLLSTDYPDDDNYGNGDNKNLGKKIRKKIKERPKRYALYAVSTCLGIFIIIIAVMIANLLTKPVTTKDDNTAALDGFDYLMEQGSKETGEESVSDATESNGQAGYFLSPNIKQATVSDSLVQIGEKVYKLPVSISEMEKDGISLIILGSQPPSEEAVLDPQMRNGYIQFGNYRFEVTLKNGEACNYHDLRVCGISSEEQGSSIYVAKGITVGSEEASLPDAPDNISQDALNSTTYYTWGSVTDTPYNITGRRLYIAVDVGSGKVGKISVFDDGTITD